MSVYVIVKFVHIVLAIMVIGISASGRLWLERAVRAPEHLPFTLRSIQFIEDYLTKPGLVLLLISGGLMLLVGGIPLTTFWLWVSVVLWALVLLILYLVYAPLLRRQIRLLASVGADSPDYRSTDRRAQMVGATGGVFLLVIIWLMVTKPTPF